MRIVITPKQTNTQMKESFMNAESLFNENAPIFRFSQLRLKLKVKTIVSIYLCKSIYSKWKKNNLISSKLACEPFLSFFGSYINKFSAIEAKIIQILHHQS